MNPKVNDTHAATDCPRLPKLTRKKKTFFVQLTIKPGAMPRSLPQILIAVLAAGTLMLSSSAGVSSSVYAAEPEVVRYTINAARSEFIVHAQRGGLFGFAGHDHTIAIRCFTGEAALTHGTVEPASLQLKIVADSLFVIDDVQTEERTKIERDMRKKVLETQKFPDLVFKSTKVTVSKIGEGEYNLTIAGDLTLHGVTRTVEIASRLMLHDNSLRATGEFSLKQKDFDMTPIAVAAGTVKVKDELQFSFDIVADELPVN